MRGTTSAVLVLAATVSATASAAAAPGASVTIIQVFPGANAIKNALASAHAGDTLNIHAGTYPEHVSVVIPNLLLKQAGDGPVTVDGTCSSSWTIQVTADGVRFQGLQVVGGTFGEITFTDVTSGGVRNVVGDDTCGSAEYGINVFRGGSIVLRNNTLSGFSDAGIYIGAISSTPFGPLLVQGNEGLNNDRGIIVEDSAGGTIRVVRNAFHDNDSTGIWLHNSDGVAIRGNSVNDNGFTGIELDEASDGNLIDRNTANGQPYDLANDGGTGNCWQDNDYTTSRGDISC